MTQVTRSLRLRKLPKCSKADAERYYWERAIPKQFWEQYRNLRELLVSYVVDERFGEKNGCRPWSVEHPHKIKPRENESEKPTNVVFATSKAGAIAEWLQQSRGFLRQHPIKRFKLECIPLEITLFKIICDHLIPMEITELDLRNCHLGVEHCVALEQLIRRSPSLRILKLGGNELCGKSGNSKGLESVFKHLLSDPKLYLDELHLYRCKLGPSAFDTIIKSLKFSLKKVKDGSREHGIVKKKLNLSYNPDLKAYANSLTLKMDSFAQESGLEIWIN